MLSNVGASLPSITSATFSNDVLVLFAGTLDAILELTAIVRELFDRH